MKEKNKEKIKVMHFVSGLVSGGVEEMLYNYCKFMDHERFEFIVVYQHEPVKTCIEKIRLAGCRTIRITARNENFIKNIKDSVDIIKNEKPDIVHAHMNLMNFCALFAAYKNKVEVRISHSHIAEKNRGRIFNIFAKLCKKLCVKYATDLFACGKEAGDYLYGENRMQRGEVKIIENAVDLDYFVINQNARKKFRERFNIGDSFVVGHIGRFTYQKNHERVINIFNSILQKKRESVLLLVGTGELENSIRNLVAEKGIAEKVIFLGTTSNMNEVYSSMDVFILPSRFEGFPVVSMEVQAANIPSIFSNTIAPTCKVTEAIHFVSLDKSDDKWCDEVLNHYSSFKPCDLSELKNKYDIRPKAKNLEKLYFELLNRG